MKRIAHAACISMLAASLAFAGDRPAGAPIMLDGVTRLEVTTRGGVAGPVVRGNCDGTSTHTDATFQPGAYIQELGFAQGEYLIAQYTLPATTFPIRIESMETLFVASDTFVPTTTWWSVVVWDGPPTGAPFAVYSSDGTILPHATIPATGTGTALGVNLVVVVDPNDPEQIILTNPGATNTFSVGFRIDQHNNPPANPCLASPPQNSNAFPVVDVSGVESLDGNWLDALDCFGFCDGLNRFGELLPFICRPSGDWVIRASWESINCQPPTGACCAGGTCTVRTAAECAAASGVYRGDGTVCSPNPCPQPTVACCFASTGGCVNLTVSNCMNAGGIPQAAGSSCGGGFICFPRGACCLPNGNCVDNIRDTDCAAQGGVFQGHNSLCSGISCPQPTGACCFDTGFCLVLTQLDCTNAGAAWRGPQTDCSDGNGNGAADACEPCSGDLNGDHIVNESDLGVLLGAWRTSAGGDLTGDGQTDEADLGVLLGRWGLGC